MTRRLRQAVRELFGLTHREVVQGKALRFPTLEVLDGYPGINLLLPGGEVRTKELSLAGGLSELAFSQLRFDTFVMGVCGIDTVSGVTTQMLAEADVKRSAAKAAHRVIAVTDASKIGRVAFGHVCDIADIDILVTDASADELIVHELIAAGLEVRRA